jgi:uncharacterized protein
VFGQAGKYWMQWLHDELVKLDIEVMMPNLANAEDPSVEEWRSAIQNLIKDINPAELIIIGHSLGVPAALNVIQDLQTPLNTLISVAGFYKDYGLEINTEYLQACTIDIQKAAENINHKYVIYSDNDPYVPQAELKARASELKGETVIVPNGGHFNADTEYTREFPLLINIVKELLIQA